MGIELIKAEEDVRVVTGEVLSPREFELEQLRKRTERSFKSARDDLKDFEDSMRYAAQATEAFKQAYQQHIERKKKKFSRFRSWLDAWVDERFTLDE